MDYEPASSSRSDAGRSSNLNGPGTQNGYVPGAGRAAEQARREFPVRPPRLPAPAITPCTASRGTERSVPPATPSPSAGHPQPPRHLRGISRDHAGHQAEHHGTTPNTQDQLKLKWHWCLGATTATAVTIAASGRPRVAAAFRMRASRAGAAAFVPADTPAGTFRWVAFALLDTVAIA